LQSHHYDYGEYTIIDPTIMKPVPTPHDTAVHLEALDIRMQYKAVCTLGLIQVSATVKAT